jgi:hypothetical protein
MPGRALYADANAQLPTENAEVWKATAIVPSATAAAGLALLLPVAVFIGVRTLDPPALLALVKALARGGGTSSNTRSNPVRQRAKWQRTVCQWKASLARFRHRHLRQPQPSGGTHRDDVAHRPSALLFLVRAIRPISAPADLGGARRLF